ncbi:MAG: FHA domain-containing protein [Anaerolineae bacterium]|nr:FHA domain-containing protein [Anaerolineae bacterium]
MTDQPKPDTRPTAPESADKKIPEQDKAPAPSAAAQPPKPDDAKPTAVGSVPAAPKVDEAAKSDAAPAPVSTDAKAPATPSVPPAVTASGDKPAEKPAVPVTPSAPPAATASGDKPAEKPAAPATPSAPPAATVSGDKPAEKPAAPTQAPAPVSTDAKPASPSPAELKTAPVGDKLDTIPPLSGGQKVTQRFPETSSGSQPATGGQICPTCGHRNRPGVLICDNCGTNLVGGVKATLGTRDLMREQEISQGQSVSAEQAKAVESAGSTLFQDDMVLRIEIEGGATPMLVYPKQEIIFGRRDPNTGTLPDVDLTAFAGYRMGVSRRHSSIRLQDKQLNLSDLGSSNGTFLNGTRLVSHRPYPVRDGDEIRLGQMVLKIYFQSNKSRN